MTRPNWDEYFLGIAWAVAERSDCRRSKVGAVLVGRSHRILSTGYVGVQPGQPGCLDGACPRGLKSFQEVAPYSPYTDCISIHAEVNCINFADIHYDDLWDGSTMYVTRRPCQDCEIYCVRYGVRHFVFPSEDDDLISSGS